MSVTVMLTVRFVYSMCIFAYKLSKVIFNRQTRCFDSLSLVTLHCFLCFKYEFKGQGQL